MPVFDMQLPQLREYKGSTPKPEDFDAYWAKALKELDETAPMPKLEIAKFSARNADCFDLTFTGVRGAKVYAQYLRPKTKGPHPCILQFHGYGGQAGNWSEKLGMVSEGYCVAALDVRGQAGKSQDSCTYIGDTRFGHIIRGLENDDPQDLFFRHVFLDTVQLARVVSSFEEVDENRLACKGGSQGGALAIVCAALHDNIKLTVSQHPFLSDYKRVWHLDLPSRPYAEIYEYFSRFDPCHEREDEIFTKLGYIDIQNLAQRIKTPVLFGIGLTDNVCPPSSQFAVYNKLGGEVKLHIYHDFGHVLFPGWADKIHEFLQDL